MSRKKKKEPAVKLSEKKNGALSFDGKRGKVSFEFNQEAEYKVGLFFRHEPRPSAPDIKPSAKIDERRIASVGMEIWTAYRETRYEKEDREGLGPEQITLADGQQWESYRSEAKKERRIRPFFIMAAGHPCDLEIRQEIKNGKKMTMIKLGNGAHDGAPVINRKEIMITSHVDEEIGTLLRGLLAAELSEKTRELITHAFNEQTSFVPALRSETIRDKSQNIRTHYKQGGRDFVVVFEPAYDLGSGRTMAGQPWAIREYEGEVKHIYLKDSDVDIKENPEEAGLSEEDIRAISENVLLRERRDFINFAERYLAEKTLQDPVRYGDIMIEPIYKSKSRPGLNKLNPVLEQGGSAVERAIKYNQEHGFAVHENLLRRPLRNCA